MDDAVLATLTANVERDFSKLAKQDSGYEKTYDFQVEGSDETYTYTLEVLDTMEFTNEYGDTVKAIAFRDQDGNIYVHYNGTGDGNWGYNSVAYGNGTSKVQDESLAFFDKVMEEHYREGDNVYVGGHSQGGNNAMYVTMNSEYGNRIDMCMAMDAPGFSYENVEAMKNRYGEDYYEKQRHKIYAFNGDSDFVNPLGQMSRAEDFIPPEHVTIIEGTKGNSFDKYHDIRGKMDGNNLRKKVDDYSTFSKIVEGINEKVKDLPQDKQERFAELVMKAAEYFLGGGNHNWGEELTVEEWIELAFMAVPIIVDYFMDNPEMIYNILKDLDLPPYIAEVVYGLFLAFRQGYLTVVALIEFFADLYNNIKNYLRGISPGGRYVKENPYFKADPAVMRQYADRLSRVNKRLVQLDKDMNDLYLQVRLRDLDNILKANLVTTYSVYVGLAAKFLNSAADKLDKTENKVLGYMGG